MLDGRVAQIADHPPGQLKGRSSIPLPATLFRLISEIVSVFKMGFVHQGCCLLGTTVQSFWSGR